MHSTGCLKSIFYLEIVPCLETLCIVGGGHALWQESYTPRKQMTTTKQSWQKQFLDARAMSQYRVFQEKCRFGVMWILVKLCRFCLFWKSEKSAPKTFSTSAVKGSIFSVLNYLLFARITKAILHLGCHKHGSIKKQQNMKTKMIFKIKENGFRSIIFSTGLKLRKSN